MQSIPISQRSKKTHRRNHTIDYSKTSRKSYQRHSVAVPTQTVSLRGETNFGSLPAGTLELKTALTKSVKSGGMKAPVQSISLKNSVKTPASFEKQMTQRMLGLIRKNHVNPQLLNMLRYELFRIDVDRTMLIASKTFKDIYRNLNIKMP